VLLTTSYPELPGDSAGHFVETEAFTLARQGKDVHVIAPGRRASVRTVLRERAAVTVWGAGGGSLFGRPGALLRAREQPFRLLELVRFVPSAVRLLRALAPVDLTVAHFLLPSAYPLALAATGATEVVLHGSDVRIFVGLPSMVRAHVVQRLLTRGSHFRFVSEELRSTLLLSLSADQRHRVHSLSRVELPPIDLPRSSMQLAQLELELHVRPRWVTCSRLVATKRVDRCLLEAAKRNVDLTVIGDGPLRAELEALAASLEPRARFLGHLSRPEALGVIANSHKLLHLSESEGAPTVIREARALGIPVLATAVGDVARWALDDPGIEIFRPM
jgi:teichuronic acid biosynthesis glycosyltransferase TuaC